MGAKKKLSGRVPFFFCCRYIRTFLLDNTKTAKRQIVLGACRTIEAFWVFFFVDIFASMRKRARVCEYMSFLECADDDDIKEDMDEKHNGIPDTEAAGADYDAIRERVFRRKQKLHCTKQAPRQSDLRLDVKKWHRFFWKPDDDIEAKVQYVLEFGNITSAKTPADIARYLLTLYDMRQPETLQSMVEHLFQKNPSEVDQNIRNNLQACSMINPQTLVDTPLHNYEFYKPLIVCLSHAHSEHVRYALHFRSAIQAYSQQRAMDPLLSSANADPPPEPPARDTDGSQRAVQDKKPWQLLLAFLLCAASAKGARRDAKGVYEPQYANKQFTRFYVRVGDMSSWILNQVNENDNPAEYDALTKDKKTFEYLLYELAQIPDARFPFLRVCRTLFSYENGIFNADNGKFYPYVSPPIFDPESRLGDITTLPADIATAQFFGGVTVPIAWFHKPNAESECIETPSIDKIFKDQAYDKEELRWVRAFHGRALHDISTRHEDWQIVVHTKGPAGCGKSIIGKVLRAWFPKERFGVLNDDMQDSFPDGHLVDVWCLVAFDVSPDFTLSPTRFLCYASGDELAMLQKFGDPVTKAWTAPVFFFSNYELPVQGGSGSAIRRALIIPMSKAVLRTDGQLTHNALKEAGFYLIKCTFDYLHKCRLHGKQSLWDDPTILPAKFWEGREQYAKASSWPDAFLLSGRFRFGPNLEVPADAFKREYANFQQVQKALPGVNRSRRYGRSETRVPPCAPTEFANALRSIRSGACFWDTDRDVICGLAFAQDQQDALDAPVQPRLTQQRQKRPHDPDSSFAHTPKTPRLAPSQEPGTAVVF